jgi:thermitase
LSEYLHRTRKRRKSPWLLSASLPALIGIMVVQLAVGSVAQDSQPNYVPGEVLVGVRMDADDDGESARLTPTGSIVNHSLRFHDYHLKLKAGLTVEAAIAQLVTMPEVLYAEPNWYSAGLAPPVPNDTYWATASTSGFSPQYGPQDIMADMAWSIWSPRKQIVIAILDTGIKTDHPDLINKIYKDSLSNIISYNAIANPYSPTNPNPGTSAADDDNGHGSHCAGIAAAQVNNSAGIAGVAGATWNGTSLTTDVDHTKLMPVKVLSSSNHGNATEAGDGIEWAADHGANIISMSFYSSTNNTYLADRVEYAWNKGCVLVACAGNEGSSMMQYPAANSHVISVAANDSTDKLAGFSTYGSWVLVSAPGGQGADKTHSTQSEEILSTWIGSSTAYFYDFGTSMACPHVSGEAALIWSQNPALTNAQVNDIITSHTDTVTPYTGTNTIANGRVNAYTALQATGGFNWKAVALVDLKADGKPDIIFQNRTTGVLVYWLMNGVTETSLGFLSPSAGPGSQYWHAFGIGDINADGKPDVLFQDFGSSTGTMAYWQMLGTTENTLGNTTPDHSG